MTTDKPTHNAGYTTFRAGCQTAGGVDTLQNEPGAGHNATSAKVMENHLHNNLSFACPTNASNHSKSTSTWPQSPFVTVAPLLFAPWKRLWSCILKGFAGILGKTALLQRMATFRTNEQTERVPLPGLELVFHTQRGGQAKSLSL